jgi:hypothetical protein
VLLGPKFDEPLGHPAAECAHAVEARMTTRAYSDQEPGCVGAGHTMVDMNPIADCAHPAAISIAFEHGFAPAAKACF